MSSTTLHECERCGAEQGRGSADWHCLSLRFGTREVNLPTPVQSPGSRDGDICPACLASFTLWWGDGQGSEGVA